MPAVKVKNRACIVITELTNGHIDIASLEFTGVNHSDDDEAPAPTQFADGMIAAFRAIYEHSLKNPGKKLFEEPTDAE